MAIVLPATFTAVDKFSSVVMKMDKSVGTFARKTEARVNRVNRAFRRLTPSLKGVGTQLKTLVGITAAIALFNLAASGAIAYDNSLRELAAITGVNEKAMVTYNNKLLEVAKNQKVAANEVADAAGLVGSAKPELLANAAALAQVTEQAILLSKAGGIDVPTAADALTNALNQFGEGADKAAMFTDILATSQQKGTARIDKLSEALIKSGGTARAFGLSFDQTNALLQGFAKGGELGSEAGTQLAGILAKLSQVGKKEFNPVHTNAIKIIDNLAKANLSYTQLLKMTDVRGAKWLTTLINQNDTVQKLAGNLNDVGSAQKQADEKALSFAVAMKELTATFQNFFIIGDQNNGVLIEAAKKIRWVTDNLGTIISVTMSVVKWLLILKATLLITTGSIFAYNVVLGITAALSGVVSLAVGKSAVALGAYKTVLALVTAAQWLWAIALNVGIWPLTLIALGIAATIALITVIIKKWDTWGAALTIFLGPLGMVISMFQSFRRNWEMIKESFRTGGIVSGLKAIGVTLLDAVLMPLQQLLEIIAKVPGSIGDFAAKGASSIDAFRTNTGASRPDLMPGTPTPLSPVKNIDLNQTRSELFQETVTKSFQEQFLNINVNDPNNRTESTLNGQPIPINLSPVS